MICKFYSLFNNDIFNNSRIIFIIGSNNIFNEYAIDKYRSKSSSLVEDDNGNMVEYFNKVDIGSLMEVKDTPTMLGIWYTKCTWEELSNNMKKKVEDLISDTKGYYRLVIECTDYKKFNEIRKLKGLKQANKVVALELQYPDKDSLVKYVKEQLEKKGFSCTLGAAEIFVNKLSNNYDLYKENIDFVIEKSETDKITDNVMNKLLDGVQYYSLDDLMNTIIKGTESESTNTKIIKTMLSVTNDIGKQGVINYVIKEANRAIGYHNLIYKGFIPIRKVEGKYGKSKMIPVFKKDETVRRLESQGKKEKAEEIGKISDWVYGKQIERACKLDVAEWTYIKSILEKAVSESKFKAPSERELILEKALYDVCIRNAVNSEVISNQIDQSSIFDNIDDVIDSKYGIKK